MSLEIVTNVNNLPTLTTGSVNCEGASVPFDKAMFLANAAHNARISHNERTPANFLLHELSGYQGIEYARSLIISSTLLNLDRIRVADVSPETWLGVIRQGQSIAGAILVQRSVSVKFNDEIIIDNGTCVEGFVVDKSNAHLINMYSDGLTIADAIAGDQTIFSIESAPRRQSILDIFREGKHNFDDEFLRNMGKIYAFRSDQANYERNDMPGAAQVPKFIYSNSKI